jgi:hypothetical protein
MTPAARSALIERAKRAATPVASCVAARISPAHILAAMAREEVDALVIVLADAVDHALLRAVVEADDDGRPGLSDLDARYRAGHAEAVRLRAAKLPVPNQVRVLDSGYYRGRKQARQNLAATAETDMEAAS